ncbi:hypothetical protein BG015_009918 [Linnemannia schmuckeri]|uniref:Uncharacterized protein n=1 Tax=Linnemannia schmuckeri TaxID=64567 RepID=A0A9P5RY89_9FUNG|nr:hypothetical protein BG015_009918 [Linnemannia schmuckeri]
MATSYEVQRRFYAQLGRMTGLKELVLGVTDFSPAMLTQHDLDPSRVDSVKLEQVLWGYRIQIFNYFSLSFSLMSGLELLEGLKELEVLDVRMAAHDIGVEELEWMHTNWPRLREIRVLDSERGWACEGVNGVATKAAVDRSRGARNALARNSQYNHTIETTDPAMVFTLTAIRLTITKLESLTLRLKDYPTSNVNEIVVSTNVVALGASVSSNSTSTVEIARCVSDVIRIRILHNNPDLRSLSLNDGREGMKDLVAAFSTAKLEKLELSFLHSVSFDRGINGGNEEFDAEKSIENHLDKHEPFHDLKEIVITGGGQNYMNPNRLVFLLWCPNVEIVRLHRLDSKAMRALAVYLKAGCPLANMEWRKGFYDPEKFIVVLLRASTLG